MAFPDVGVSRVPLATGAVAGLLAPSDKTKLDNLAANASTAYAASGHNHDASYAAIGHVGSGGAAHAVVTPDPGGTAGFMSPADKQKLDGLSSTTLSFAMVGEQETRPTGGTPLPSNSWNTIVLNGEAYDPDNIVSLSGGNFVLDAGTYLVEWWIPVYSDSSTDTWYDFRSKLLNVTDTINYMGTMNTVRKYSSSVTVGSAHFTIGSTKTFSVLCDINSGANAYAGHGDVALVFPAGEPYWMTQVKITKLP